MKVKLIPFSFDLHIQPISRQDPVNILTPDTKAPNIGD